MEKERCHGCDKWFTWIEQHLMYHNHCQSVMVEHACQQRLVVKCHNCNNGLDPLIGTIVVASAPEVDDGMSTGMSTRGTKRQRCIEQEDDNQSNVTFEGIDVVDDFGPMIPSPSGDVDPICGSRIVSCCIWQSWSASDCGRATACLRSTVLHKHQTRHCH
jgi:hypothetical protein